MRVVEDVANRHAWQAGFLFELAGRDGRGGNVIGDLDGEVTHVPRVH